MSVAEQQQFNIRLQLQLECHLQSLARAAVTYKCCLTVISLLYGLVIFLVYGLVAEYSIMLHFDL